MHVSCVDPYDNPALVALCGQGGIGAAVRNLEAAGDYSGPGALEVPLFEREIVDIVRRTSPALERIRTVPATGHPHRYFEQLTIATAAAADPRNLSTTPTGPSRVERYAPIKAVVAGSNLSLFDRDVTEQQGQFAALQAKDVEDILSGITVKRAKMLWAGSDTSLYIPTTLEWVGALSQITLQGTIPVGTSIIDGLKTYIAKLVADTAHNQLYAPWPSAITLNPLLIDLIEQEAKANHIELGVMEITAGTTVKSLATQAGIIPLVPDPYMPTDTASKYGFAAPPAGTSNYYAVISTEKWFEIPYIGKDTNGRPRVFQLGLTGNLAGQFVGVQFDALIVKGYSYAHTTVAVVR
jgi:hypothetical protein